MWVREITFVDRDSSHSHGFRFSYIWPKQPKPPLSAWILWDRAIRRVFHLHRGGALFEAESGNKHNCRSSTSNWRLSTRVKVPDDRKLRTDARNWHQVVTGRKRPDDNKMKVQHTGKRPRFGQELTKRSFRKQ